MGERMRMQHWHGWRPRLYGPRTYIPRMPTLFWKLEGRAMFGNGRAIRPHPLWFPMLKETRFMRPADRLALKRPPHDQ